jgi:ABC-2 type transport system permease protein
MRETNAIITIAFRDLTKLLRDKTRLVSSFVFPILFIGVLGAGFNASFGDGLGYSFITFVFTGILAQTLFQSTASGVISLVEDRENDFSKELFVAPVSRYSIITGKILGESLVSLTQAVGIVIFGSIIGVPLSLNIILIFLPVTLLVSMLGGAFGICLVSERQIRCLGLLCFRSFF